MIERFIESEGALISDGESLITYLDEATSSIVFYYGDETNEEIDLDCVMALSRRQTIYDGEVYLGATPSKVVTLTLSNQIEGNPQPFSGIPEKIEITINGILTDTVLLDEVVEKNDISTTLNFTDAMVRLDTKVDISAYIQSEGGTATLLQIAQYICANAKGTSITLATTDFRGYDRTIANWSSVFSAREYIGFIAELNGGYAYIGNDGKLYFAKLNAESAYTIDAEEVSGFQKGEEITYTRIVYDNGDVKWDAGDETGATMYLDSNNLFIDVSTAQDVYDIFSDIEGLTIYPMNIEQCEQTTAHAGQILSLSIDDTLYPFICNVDQEVLGAYFVGGYNSNVKSTIQQETKVISDAEKIRNISTTIDRINNTFTREISELSGDIDDTRTLIQQTASDFTIVIQNTKLDIESDYNQKFVDNDEKLDALNDKIEESSDALTVFKFESDGLHIQGKNDQFEPTSEMVLKSDGISFMNGVTEIKEDTMYTNNLNVKFSLGTNHYEFKERASSDGTHFSLYYKG